MGFSDSFKSPLRTKIMEFYSENPSCIETSRGIAAWLAVERRRAKKALEELTEYRILLAHRTSFATGYSYTQNKSIIKAVDKYIKGVKR